MNFIWIAVLAVIVLLTAAVGQGDNNLALLSTIIFFPSTIALYFSPGIVAHTREHPNRSSITILNLLLGWTVIGWVAALVWAYSSTESVVTSEAISPSAPAQRTCPYCAESILVAAIKCRYCGSDIVAVRSEAAAQAANSNSAVDLN